MLLSSMSSCLIVSSRFTERTAQAYCKCRNVLLRMTGRMLIEDRRRSRASAARTRSGRQALIRLRRASSWGAPCASARSRPRDSLRTCRDVSARAGKLDPQTISPIDNANHNYIQYSGDEFDGSNQSIPNAVGALLEAGADASRATPHRRNGNLPRPSAQDALHHPLTPTSLALVRELVKLHDGVLHVRLDRIQTDAQVRFRFVEATQSLLEHALA
mmetsp:Transcript_26411/g.86635  ORF Transcript_26411/g.86635 Transcript_26411/m.86635 type:complete len:216 (+) Transcript_26411:66-713(+)